ncbi:MAG: PAS domain S-box protein [Chloroflexi bacterium]|nr:PAS domain S-box protein [Chloroflexota bacterium]
MVSYFRDQLYRQIVDNARDAIIVADKNGVIRLWNSGAEAIFGYDASEAIGQTLDLIIPERFRQRHWEGYRKVMATGVTRYNQGLLAVPGTRKDGTRLSLEFTIVLLDGSGGSPMGAAAFMRDVTERWQREKAVAERLSELEAQLGEKEPA